MAVKKKRSLGRGLDVLLARGESTSNTKKIQVEEAIVVENENEMRNIPVDLIQKGKYQPRTDMHPESLEDLANSIKAQGVVQPIVLRPINDDKYEIVAGERRWRACQMAGLDEIPAIVRGLSDKDAIALALIENIQRENLNPLEEANSIHRLLTEFELTHQEAAEAIGRSRATVTNLLRLMDLNDDVKKLLENGDLEMGHARSLLGLKGSDQSFAAQQVVAKDLTVRETEKLVKNLQNPQIKKTTSSRLYDSNVKSLEDDLSKTLGAIVSIKQSTKGKGKLVINYNDLDELDGILAHIK